MITLCTLFNTNYLDKGLTMYESIDRYTHDFVLYVLCMDDRCYEIIKDLNRPRFIPVKLSDFETPELLKVKGERSMGEYCWTCGSCFADYVMNNFSPEYCAYIDSDLYFYDDVNVVVKEMQERNASVMITGHRFNWYDRKYMEWWAGKYCVEFNTFKNDANGCYLLNLWKQQCIDYCKMDGDGVHFADQKYLDNWCRDYPYAIETNNLGAGIAPWNIAQYKYSSNDIYGPNIVICNGHKLRPFFYHFQHLCYITENLAETKTGEYWGVDFCLVRSFYIPYLKHIRLTKLFLQEKYSVNTLIRKHPALKETVQQGILTRLYKILDYGVICKKIRLNIFHAIPEKINKNKSILKF